MDDRVLQSYASQELFKYGATGGLCLLTASLFKFTEIGNLVGAPENLYVTYLFLTLTWLFMSMYALILLDINLKDYIELEIESIDETHTLYGEVVTKTNKTYYYDATQKSYTDVDLDKLCMVVTKRFKLPVMLIIK